MKKWAFLLLTVIVAALFLGGCGNKEDAGSSSALSSAAPTMTPSPTPAQMAKAVLVDADGGLNVRSEASTDGEILGVADDGSMLPLLLETPKDGWYQVEYQGKTAYVSAEYAQVKEISLETYNGLKNGGTASSSPSSSLSSSAASSAAPVSSTATPSPSPTPSAFSGDSEDGE